MLLLWFHFQAFAGGAFRCRSSKLKNTFASKASAAATCNKSRLRVPKRGGVAVAQLPGRVVQWAGSNRHRHQKAAGDVRLHVLPERIALRNGDALALHGAVKRIAKFQHVQRSERQRGGRWLATPPALERRWILSNKAMR
jgi:hypothetical protein